MVIEFCLDLLLNLTLKIRNDLTKEVKKSGRNEGAEQEEESAEVEEVKEAEKVEKAE